MRRLKFVILGYPGHTFMISTILWDFVFFSKDHLFKAAAGSTVWHTHRRLVSIASKMNVKPGVYEAALAYTDALRMADNTSLFKLTAKSIGYKYK